MLELRGRVGLIASAALRIEQSGCEANDFLATHLVGRICKSNGVFVDVGAHIGSVISAVRRHSNPTIIAIEAMPDKTRQLIKKFPDVDVHACAVGAAPGTATFYVNLYQSGYSSLIKPAGAHPIEEIQVPVKRLDDVISSDAVDVIKIDVEGAELAALHGAQAVLAKSRPLVMFESGPKDESELVSMWEFFEGADYEILVPDRLAHDGAGLSRGGFLDSHSYPRRTTNYFAVPRERRAEYRTRAQKILRIE